MNFIHWIAGLIVLAEALNKLERCNIFCAGLTLRMCVVEWLKTIGWALLALGAGVAVLSPLLLSGPYLVWLRPITDTAALIGFAALVVRTRVREGTYKRRQEDRTHDHA